MKYLFSFVLSILIVVSSATSAFSSENITFKLQNTECKTNRLFTVDMIAKCDKPLSAATFEFIYNTEMFEYRSIKVKDDESQISANCKNGSVKAVFLNTYGQNIDSDTAIFSITFKAIKAGTGYIDFNVEECVNSDIEWLDIGKCTSSTITITPSKSNISDSSSKNKTKKDKTNSDKDKSKSERVTEPITTSSATIDEYGPINNSIENSNQLLLLIGFMFGCGLIIFIVFIIMILKKIAAKK